jgi:hypothetical protein
VTQRHEVSTCCWKSDADRLPRRRVATNLQFIKDAISAFPTGNAQATEYASDAGRRRAKKRTVGCAISRVVSCQHLTSEARTQSQQSMWYLWWAKWHRDMFFSKNFAFLLPLVILPMLHSIIYHPVLVHWSTCDPSAKGLLSHPTARIKEHVMRQWSRRV